MWNVEPVGRNMSMFESLKLSHHRVFLINGQCDCFDVVRKPKMTSESMTTGFVKAMQDEFIKQGVKGSIVKTILQSMTEAVNNIHEPDDEEEVAPVRNPFRAATPPALEQMEQKEDTKKQKESTKEEKEEEKDTEKDEDIDGGPSGRAAWIKFMQGKLDKMTPEERKAVYTKFWRRQHGVDEKTGKKKTKAQTEVAADQDLANTSQFKDSQGVQKLFDDKDAAKLLAKGRQKKPNSAFKKSDIKGFDNIGGNLSLK